MSLKSNTFIFSNQTDWELVADGVSRRIMGYDDNLMQVAVRFEEGAVGTVHKHFHSQTCYVVSGVFEFTIGEESHLVKAGDGLYMEPDIEHGVRCMEEGILLDSFNPTRLDFLY